jgi:hypothetical protein
MSSSTASFEVLPFRSYGQAQSEEIRHRMGGGGARSPGAIGARRGAYHGPHRPPHGPRRPIGAYDPAVVQTGVVPDYTQTQPSSAAPSEQIRWVQFALNQIQNANLPTDGFASPDLRAALRDFQGRNGLPVSGFVGPDTIAALQRASKSGSAEEIFGEIFEIGPKGIDEATMNWARGVLAKIDMDIGNQPARPFVRSQVPKGVPQVKGLYRITWGAAGPYHGRARMYNGKATRSLYLRIQQHAKEARQLGFTLDGFEVRVLPLSRCSDQQLRALEWLINEKYIGQSGVTNERRELELPEIQAF